MPNRILKESICSSENIDQLTPFEETVFYRLMVNCDDFGRMDARQKILKANLFPLKDIAQHELEQAMRSLMLADLVIPYEVDGKQYYQIKNWEKHQRIRAKRGKYPAAADVPQTVKSVLDERNDRSAHACDLTAHDSELTTRDSKLLTHDSELTTCDSELTTCDSELLTHDSNCPPESNPIQSKKNQNPKGIQSRARTRMREEAFTRFWREYPRRESKKTAKQAFDRLDPDPELFQEMLDAIASWKKTDQWQKNGGQFIPHPATWLNQRRWEDELPKTTAGSGMKTVAAQQYEQRRYEVREETPEEILARLQADQGTTGTVLFVPPLEDAPDGMPEKKEEDTEA